MTDTQPARPSGSSRLLRSSAVVGVGTAISRLTGFGRVAAVAYAFGATTVAGVYAYANETPNILYELLLGGILTATLLPLFVRSLADGDEEAQNAIVTVAGVALLVITIIGVAIAPLIVRIYTIDVHGPTADDQRELATTWLRCFMPQIFFYGMTALAADMLNARRRFAAAAFAPILNNVVVITMFLSLPRLVDGPITLETVVDDPQLTLYIGLGTTAGIATMALALWPALRRAGVRLKPRLRVAPRGRAHDAAALRLDRGLRDHQPDRAVGRARIGQRQVRRRVRVPERVRVLPVTSRAVRGVDHHGKSA